MAPCVAFGCSNRSCKKVPGITFHNFPVNQERKTAWIKAVRRENWFPTKSSKLCSEHFAEEDIDRTSVSSVRIRENAVPSIFKAFPSYLQKVPKKRKAPPAKIHHEELEEQNVETNNIMGRKCCVPGCRSNNHSEPGYTAVFQFPREDGRRQAWIRNIKRDNFNPIKSTVVCIRHFEDRFIVREDRATRDDGSVLVVPRKHMGLSSDAVPTRFPVPTGRKAHAAGGGGGKTKMAAPAAVVPASRRRAKMASAGGGVSKVNCCVVGCTNYYAKFQEGGGHAVSFYRFPTQRSWPARRLQWIAAVNRQGPDGKLWTPKFHSRVCSEHFVGGKKSDHPRHPAFAPTIMPDVGPDPPDDGRQRKRARTSAVDWEELAALRDPGATSTAILPKLGAAERLMSRPHPHPQAKRGGTALDTPEDDVDGYLQPRNPDELLTKIKQEPLDYEPEPAPEQTPLSIDRQQITPNTSQNLKNLRKLAPALAAEPRSLLRTYSKDHQQLQLQRQQGSEAENEFDLFCRSLAVQLKNMPLHRALACQEKLQGVMVQERLAQLRRREEAMGCANTDLPASETSCFPIVEAMYDDE